MVLVGIFLVVNGVLDVLLSGKTRATADLLIGLAGISLGILVLTGHAGP